MSDREIRQGDQQQQNQHAEHQNEPYSERESLNGGGQADHDGQVFYQQGDSRSPRNAVQNRAKNSSGEQTSQRESKVSLQNKEKIKKIYAVLQEAKMQYYREMGLENDENTAKKKITDSERRQYQQEQRALHTQTFKYAVHKIDFFEHRKFLGYKPYSQEKQEKFAVPWKPQNMVLKVFDEIDQTRPHTRKDRSSGSSEREQRSTKQDWRIDAAGRCYTVHTPDSKEQNASQHGANLSQSGFMSQTKLSQMRMHPKDESPNRQHLNTEHRDGSNFRPAGRQDFFSPRAFLPQVKYTPPVQFRERSNSPEDWTRESGWRIQSKKGDNFDDIQKRSPRVVKRVMRFEQRVVESKTGRFRHYLSKSPDAANPDNDNTNLSSRDKMGFYAFDHSDFIKRKSSDGAQMKYESEFEQRMFEGY